MATSAEYIERLGKASVGVKLGILGAVLLVLGGLYYYLMYSDMSAEYDQASGNKQHLLDEERRLIKRKSDYQELVKQKKDVDDRLQKNAIKLPEASEVPAVFEHLEVQAATANVRVLSRTPEKETAIESYVKVPVRIEVAGTFWQINQYFKLLSETPRIITIENLQIGNASRQGDHLDLTAKFTASTFRQADKPAPTAAPPPQGPTEAPPPAPPKPAENPAGANPAPPKPGPTPGPTPAPGPAPAPAPAPPAPAPAPGGAH